MFSNQSMMSTSPSSSGNASNYLHHHQHSADAILHNHHHQINHHHSHGSSHLHGWSDGSRQAHSTSPLFDNSGNPSDPHMAASKGAHTTRTSSMAAHSYHHSHSAAGGSAQPQLPADNSLVLPQSTLNGLNRRWSCETCRRRKLKCDGARPSCSFCAKKHFDCVYLGHKTRGDPDLESKYKAELERRKKRTTAKRSSIMVSPMPKGDETFQVDPRQSAFGFMSDLSLTPSAEENEPVVVQRPGAHESEESILIDNFFAIKPSISHFVHKRTYLRNYKIMPAYLRMAVCAAGAIVPLKNFLTVNEALWYVQQGVQLLNRALQRPRIECLQALMILSFAASCAGEKHKAMNNMEAAVNLALFLGLNIDPDHVPELAALPWPEKETRRRCWWICFIGDQVMSTMSFSEPILTRSISSVKPLGKESTWASSKAPELLQKEYDTPRSVDDNPINWQANLMEIFHKVFVAAGPAGDTSAIREVEAQLEAELCSWWNVIPSSFWSNDSDDSMFETMQEQPDRWQNMMELYFGYHGCMCLLMRRKAMQYLRNLPAMSGAQASSFNPSSLNDMAAQLENEIAFNKAIASAEAMASLIALLNRTNAFLHQLPHFTLFFCLQGAMILFMVDGLVAAGAPRPGVMLLVPPFPWADSGSSQSSKTSSKSSPAISAGAVSPGSTFRSADSSPRSSIDEYLSLMNMMGATRKFAKVMHRLAKKVHVGDWEYLDQVDRDPTKLFDDRQGGNGQEIGCPSEGLEPFTEPDVKYNQESIAGGGAWAKRVDSFAHGIRNFISTVREAREIGQSLTPSSTPNMPIMSVGALDSASQRGDYLTTPGSTSGSLSGSETGKGPSFGSWNNSNMFGGNFASLGTLGGGGGFGTGPTAVGWGDGLGDFGAMGMAGLDSLPAMTQPMFPPDGGLGLASGDDNEDAMILLDWLMSTNQESP
ncbi:hypothetical protein DFJ73DRAFT_818927 [Zopfochytrium polystomum]|nr:hypothetical protein DFJ73DRAFT_818927 [Zopfochytrium polystomum]